MNWLVVDENNIVVNIISANENFNMISNIFPYYDEAKIGYEYFPTELKLNKIQESKNDLKEYLEQHPIKWTDGEYYSITSEKQNQLTSKIMAATMAKGASIPYVLKWNSTGDVCKEWSLEDLTALAFEIDRVVTLLVTYQQEKEVEIQNCSTIGELNSIVVDYSEVSLENV